MDEADWAALHQEQQQAKREARIREQQAKAKTQSAVECVECGEAIPEARRKSLPGVQFCKDCAEEREKRRGKR